MSIINANPLLAAAGGDYQISRSVRLRSSASAYLSRTPASAGNRKTWTFSTWVKLGSLSTPLNLLYAYSADTDSGLCQLSFQSNQLRIQGISASFLMVSTPVYRDPSAWYHIVYKVDTTQATAADRVRVYVNGVEITSWSTNTPPPQNTDTAINNSVAHNIGRNTRNSNDYLDGYFAETYLIDGQALTPSSFGETDSITGVWKPKKYAGTYGTNGFYLNFSDNSAATAAAIGKDYSGNGNNWTPNNISVTAGVTYDSMLDVPTNWADGGNGRGNYCVLNPLNRSTGTAAANLSDGNLRVSPSGGINATPGAYALAASTFQVSSGKWYFESQVVNPVGGYSANAGWTNSVSFNFNQASISTGNITQVSASMGNTSLRMLAYDADAGKVWTGTNGTWDSGDPATNTGGSSLTSPAMPFIQAFQSNGSNQCDVVANFGQRPFTYTPPTGFKALNTQNLPDSTILKPINFFGVKLDTGANIKATAEAVYGSGLYAIKDRQNANNWQWVDYVRGTSAVLQSNTTAAETTYSAPSGNSVAAVWKESATAGFDIVTYTGTGVNRTVAHNLGVAPKMVIVKRRDVGGSWWVYNAYLGGAAYQLEMNSTAAKQNWPTLFNSTDPTSSVFSVGTAGDVNASGGTYVAYLFAEIAGFSKFGSYTGNGSADGPFVYCGFRPRWVMAKSSSAATSDWVIYDTSRPTYNQSRQVLYADLSNAEASAGLAIDLLSNGFKWREGGGQGNDSGTTYIYAAFAENPFKNSLAR